MSKKKDKKPKKEGKYDQKILDAMADSLEEYMKLFDIYIICEDISAEEYEKSKKKIEKLIKKLRNGGEGCIDDERYQNMMKNLHREEYFDY